MHINPDIAKKIEVVKSFFPFPFFSKSDDHHDQNNDKPPKPAFPGLPLHVIDELGQRKTYVGKDLREWTVPSSPRKIPPELVRGRHGVSTKGTEREQEKKKGKRERLGKRKALDKGREREQAKKKGKRRGEEKRKEEDTKKGSKDKRRAQRSNLFSLLFCFSPSFFSSLSLLGIKTLLAKLAWWFLGAERLLCKACDRTWRISSRRLTI